MSKLYEALTRGGGLPGVILEPLLEGQTNDAPGSSPTLLAAETNGDFPRPHKQDPEPVAFSASIGLARARSVALHVLPSSPILPFDGTHWRAGEQYRMLRTRIVQHQKKPRMLVVASAGSGDGKTVTAINLAGALALKTDARVLLLDGDFRRSAVCAKLGVPVTPGIADVLKHECALEDAIVQAAQIPNLYILPAGAAEVNPTELLDSSLWVSVCNTCRENFEYIIVDSPPKVAVADFDLLQAACDAIVVVVRPDHTDRGMTLKLFQDIPKEKLLGVVVNCVDGWLLDRDGDRYGAYYYTGLPQA